MPVVTTILAIANSDVEIAITLPKHPNAHEFLYEVLDEVGIEYRRIVNDEGYERTPHEISDAYELYGVESSSVSVIWAVDVMFLLVRPPDRERFATFIDEHTKLYVPWCAYPNHTEPF